MLPARNILGLAFLIGLQASLVQHGPVLAQGPVRTFTLTSNWVDLTHAFDESTIYWPTAGGFKLSAEQFGVTDKGYFYAANRFSAAEHGGTHLDAPIHFWEQGKSVDELSIDRFIGEAAVIDVSDACSRDADYQVNVGDLRGWEKQHGRQLIDRIVLIRTGYGRHWKERKRYLGTDRTGSEAVADLHFPGLAPEAALWLTEHRAVKSVGIDTASIDYGQSQRFQSHVTLFKYNIPVFENVANLHRLPSIGATVIALPMKITSGTGAPLRMIGSVPP